MSDSTPPQVTTQQSSWARRIPIGRILQAVAGRFKDALWLGGSRSRDRDLLKQCEDLQKRVDSLLVENHELSDKMDRETQRLSDKHDKQLLEIQEAHTTQISEMHIDLEASRVAAKEADVGYEGRLAGLNTRITTLCQDNQQLQELRDQEILAHHDRVDALKNQVDKMQADLLAAQVRFQDMESLAQNKDLAQQAHSKSLEIHLEKTRGDLAASEADAEKRNSAQRADLDTKAQQGVRLEGRVAELRLQLDTKNDLLRSMLKDLKARRVDLEDEDVRKIVAAIEAGLPPLIYPASNEQRLGGNAYQSYKDRIRQMQSAHQELLQTPMDQPVLNTSDVSPGKRSGKRSKSSKSGTEDEDDSEIMEYVRSLMKIALPQSVTGQNAEVFYRSVVDPPDKFEDGEHSHRQGATKTSEHQSSPAAPDPDKPDPDEPDPDEPDPDGSDSDEPDPVPGTATESSVKRPRTIWSNLALDKNSIRLVDILPGTGEEPLEVHVAVHALKDVSRRYEALSYVCGKDKTKYGITLNGVKFEVFANLHNALTWLRQATSTRRTWIDAMCINQASKNQKSKEIQNMGPIYSQAKTVTIFLGASLPVEEDFIGALMKFLSRDAQSNSISPQDWETGKRLADICDFHGFNAPEVRQGFVKMCLRPWFRRIWTMQEFYLASEEPLLYWGNEHCSTAALKRDFKLLEDSLRDFHHNILHVDILDFERDCGLPRLLLDKQVQHIKLYISRCFRNDYYDIPRRLYSELTAEAEDPHDFVYGIRAMFNPIFGKVFVPDYRMSTEMLFAGLAVYLVVWEGWTDLLYWYPRRFRARDSIASWWPDFTKRNLPDKLDVKPLDGDIAKEPRFHWAVQNHLLHANGYVLDKVYAHRHLDKADGHKIFSELWQFDHCMNWNHECNEYFDQITDEDDEWIRVFRDMHRDRYARITYFNSSFEGALLQSTINGDEGDKYPPQVAQCVPSWDLLLWYALRIAPPELVEALGHDATYDEPGYFEDIFSLRMQDTFQDAFADFFIGACIFDWDHLSIWIRRFTTAATWSASNYRYWASTKFSPSNNMEQRSEAILNAYNDYINEINAEVMRHSWCYSFYYEFFAYIILLDCDDHESLANIIQKLQDAAERLRAVYHSTTIQQVRDLASEVPVLADRLDYYDAVVELFRGRYLLWTDGGFRGISCPGVETCCRKGAIVVIVDGLSFPVVVNHFNEQTGEGQLAGCVLIRGADMLGRDTETMVLPDRYVRGQKRVFKFR